jgi:lipopolysaccharide/colanic/teichoic acid biosynthesis glycosyltransferase
MTQKQPRNSSERIPKLFKGIADPLIAALLLLLLFPVFLGVTIAVRVFLGSPIFFTQPRPGRNGKIFYFYKFRTMTDACDRAGKMLPDAERLTPFGSFLRQTSLDELPQLINILKGEMSFVGPRPLLVKYLDRYTPEQRRRHEVKPGITGLAQVSGRNAISWEDKFKLDVWYIDNWTLKLDLKILFLTAWKVLQQDGINQEGYTTSKEFMGHHQPPQDS